MGCRKGKYINLLLFIIHSHTTWLGQFKAPFTYGQFGTMAKRMTCVWVLFILNGTPNVAQFCHSCRATKRSSIVGNCKYKITLGSGQKCAQGCPIHDMRFTHENPASKWECKFPLCVVWTLGILVLAAIKDKVENKYKWIADVFGQCHFFQYQQADGVSLTRYIHSFFILTWWKPVPGWYKDKYKMLLQNPDIPHQSRFPTRFDRVHLIKIDFC